jgi:hypothetical protein
MYEPEVVLGVLVIILLRHIVGGPSGFFGQRLVSLEALPPLHGVLRRRGRRPLGVTRRAAGRAILFQLHMSSKPSLGRRPGSRGNNRSVL